MKFIANTPIAKKLSADQKEISISLYKELRGVGDIFYDESLHGQIILFSANSSVVSRSKLENKTLILLATTGVRFFNYDEKTLMFSIGLPFEGDKELKSLVHFHSILPREWLINLALKCLPSGMTAAECGSIKESSSYDLAVYVDENFTSGSFWKS